MAQHGHDDAHDDAHAHGDERVNRELLADREWIFDAFVRFSAWNVLIIFIILALLALTNT